MIRSHISPFLLCVVVAFSLLGEGRLHGADGDWQMWTEASWTQYLGNGLDANLRFEPRWTNDISRFSYYELETMLNWRYSPRWDFSVGYERDEQIVDSSFVNHVPSLNATLKLRLHSWNLSNRSRVEFSVPENSDMDWTPTYRNRTEVGTRLRLGSRELTPYIFEEPFFELRGGDFTQNRAGIGIGIPVIPHWMAQLYWMRLDEKTASGWEWHPVLGFQIQAKF